MSGAGPGGQAGGGQVAGDQAVVMAGGRLESGHWLAMAGASWLGAGWPWLRAGRLRLAGGWLALAGGSSPGPWLGPGHWLPG